MSLVLCGTVGCKYRVREGLRRSWLARGVHGQELADGRYCWRCRARWARGSPPAALAEKAKVPR